MNTYAKALSYAIPAFLILIIIEYVISRIKKTSVNEEMDTISSISSGITNTLKSFVGLSFVIISYSWMVKHLAIFEIKSSPWLYIITFIGLDFAGYWSHRFNHVINVFWNRHIIHHSSEEFNLSCALRQSISAFVSIYFFLYIPLAILGIPSKVIAFVAPVHFFVQFWYHTRLINKMGILEHIIVTPSHHRVHHAINDEYLDKNFSEVFIIWDKLFGTFQAELENVPPVYGVKKPVKTWNPFLINFMHIWGIAKDAYRTKKLWDKIRIWFMPTGWRPTDVTTKHPIQIIENPYIQVKYQTEASKSLKVWSWIQLVTSLLLLYHLLISVGKISSNELILYVTFLAFSIFSYTSLMDRHVIAVYAEVIKFVLGIYLVYTTDWFGINSLFNKASYLITVYLATSLLATLYFHFLERKAHKQA